MYRSGRIGKPDPASATLIFQEFASKPKPTVNIYAIIIKYGST